MSLLLIIELTDYITKMHYIAFYSRDLLRIIFFTEIHISEKHRIKQQNIA